MKPEPGKKLYQCKQCKATYMHDEYRNHSCKKELESKTVRG